MIETAELGGGSLRLRLSDRSAPAGAGTETAAPQQREAARLITMCWGDRYIDELLQFTLPALLAPGNLPAFVEHFDVELVMVTETRLFDRISRTPETLRLLRYCDLRLVPIDDLISPWYGITLTYALLRGFTDLGPAMVGAHLLFINTDFILADGSYRKLAEMIRRGERLVAAPSHCMVFEDTIEELRARYDQATCNLSFSHRELAKLALAHRHNTVRAKTVNQQLFRLHWHDQFYWYVDENTLLARHLPIAVVYMRPERVVTELETFWDYGMLSEICPTTAPCVLGDSDDFLMAELRPRSTLKSFYQLGWPSLDELAGELSRYLTKDHHDYGRHTLVLHSKNLPPQIDQEKAQLGAFMDQLYGRLSPPRSYRNHPFWLEGWDRFCLMRSEAQAAMVLREQALAVVRTAPVYAEREEHLATLRRQIAEVENAKRAVERDLAHAMQLFSAELADIDAQYNRRREELEQETEPQLHEQRRQQQAIAETLEELDRTVARLASQQAQDINRAYETIARSVKGLRGTTQRAGSSLDTVAAPPPTATEPGPATDTEVPKSRSAPPETTIASRPAPTGAGVVPRSLTRRVLAKSIEAYRTIFGQLPNTTVWHPYHTCLRYVRGALNAAVAEGACDMLFIASDDALAPTLIKGLPVNSLATTPGVAKLGMIDRDSNPSRHFDLCFCVLTFEDLTDLREIVDKIRPIMREHGRFIAFHLNRGLRPLNDFTYEFTFKVFPIIGKSKISMTGSLSAAVAMRLFTWTIANRSSSRLSGLLSLAVTLLVCAPLARAAARIEDKKNPRAYPKHCTGMTIEIELV